MPFPFLPVALGASALLGAAGKFLGGRGRERERQKRFNDLIRLLRRLRTERLQDISGAQAEFADIVERERAAREARIGRVSRETLSGLARSLSGLPQQAAQRSARLGRSLGRSATPGVFGIPEISRAERAVSGELGRVSRSFAQERIADPFAQASLQLPFFRARMQTPFLQGIAGAGGAFAGRPIQPGFGDFLGELGGAGVGLFGDLFLQRELQKFLAGQQNNTFGAFNPRFQLPSGTGAGFRPGRRAGFGGFQFPR